MHQPTCNNGNLSRRPCRTLRASLRATQMGLVSTIQKLKDLENAQLKQNAKFNRLEKEKLLFNIRINSISEQNRQLQQRTDDLKSEVITLKQNVVCLELNSIQIDDRINKVEKCLLKVFKELDTIRNRQQ